MVPKAKVGQRGLAVWVWAGGPALHTVTFLGRAKDRTATTTMLLGPGPCVAQGFAEIVQNGLASLTKGAPQTGFVGPGLLLVILCAGGPTGPFGRRYKYLLAALGLYSLRHYWPIRPEAVGPGAARRYLYLRHKWPVTSQIPKDQNTTYGK